MITFGALPYDILPSEEFEIRLGQAIDAVAQGSISGLNRGCDMFGEYFEIEPSAFSRKIYRSWRSPKELARILHLPGVTGS